MLPFTVSHDEQTETLTSLAFSKLNLAHSDFAIFISEIFVPLAFIFLPVFLRVPSTAIVRQYRDERALSLDKDVIFIRSKLTGVSNQVSVVFGYHTIRCMSSCQSGRLAE